MEGVNIKMMANRLNISIATVSKALNDSHEISDATKQRVQALAQQLNYVANPYASSLKRKNTKTIAVVIPEVADSFFALAINGIESIAQEKGYHVLIYLTHDSFLKEQAYLKDIQSGRADGIIISVSAETTDTGHIAELQAKGIPVVFFDRVSDAIECIKVTTDDYNSGYVAAAHLIRCGCRKISFLAISDQLQITQQRIMGYRQALVDNSMSFCEKDIIYLGNDEIGNVDSVMQLMKNNGCPDGIIASVEKLATTFYLVCKRLDINIPGQVKIICFSNLPTASILNPSLTTISQPAFAMGNAAAAGLFKALGNKNFSCLEESVVIPSSLVIRNSTIPEQN